MAERRYDLLVFDWDGTLMDSTAMIVMAIQAASRDLALPVPSAAQARQVIGLGLNEALSRAVPDLAPADYGRMVARYRHHYLARDHELVLFEGVAAMLSALVDAGHALAVATGKSRQGLDRALDHCGMRQFFRATRTADETFSKPHPAMLEELMDELMCEPERTLMIGDTTHDLQMARNAGTDAVGVSFGAHPLVALEAEAPRAVVHSIEELETWLRENG